MSAPVIIKCPEGTDYDQSNDNRRNDNERNDNDNRDFHNSTMLFVLASHHEVSRGDRGGYLTGQPSAPDQLVKLCVTDLTKTI